MLINVRLPVFFYIKYYIMFCVILNKMKMNLNLNKLHTLCVVR